MTVKPYGSSNLADISNTILTGESINFSSDFDICIIFFSISPAIPPHRDACVPVLLGNPQMVVFPAFRDFIYFQCLGPVEQCSHAAYLVSL